jgi:hypothetical protein
LSNAGFLDHLAPGRGIGKFTPFEAARHGLPVSRRAAPLEQQKFSAFGIDHDQDGFGPAKLLQASIDLWRRTHADVQFAKLRFAHLGGRLHQEVRGRLSLWKGDHVADAVGAGH